LRRRTKLHDVENAREAAFIVLNAYKQSDRFVSQLLDEAIDRSAAFATEQRPLAVELINGVVRRQATLDALIEPHVRRPRHRIEGELWTLLQLGAYQLVFLDDIPAYAAVNETVVLSKKVGQRGWDGFVNGVLRSVERTLTDEAVDRPAADAIPIRDGRYRRWAGDVFKDPTVAPAAYFATAFSFPRWLIDRWTARFDFDSLCAIGFWLDRTPSMTLRVNVLRTDRDRLLKELAARGVRANPGELPESIRLESTARVESLPGFADGHFTIQDESAMLAVDLLSPRAGQSVLDMCAAPGTKTTHIAERMQNLGTIVATDIRADRLARVNENCRRLGISIVRTELMPSDPAVLPAGSFEAILVDVPCSNTGVLGKRPEARWRISASDFVSLVRHQEGLLRAACLRLRRGGRLVYSTCSIEPEENEQIVRRVLAIEPAMRLVSEHCFIPGQPSDGGYQALLERTDSANDLS
jgi:16S rRNA (cytosine967-C5)-methyltransferase